MKADNYLIEMRGIHKSFDKVVALKNVDFKVREQEIVGLVGDNGAGKSTLVKILVGYLSKDEGEIYYKGEELKNLTPRKARQIGIEIVYQNLGLVDLMNISRNFFLGRELTRNIGFIKKLDHARMIEISSQVIQEVGISKKCSPETLVSVLSGGERQSINIGRAMYFQANLLILDEPTNALSVRETEWVLQQIEEARSKGVSVIFISHNLYDAYEIVDRFVILERGEKLGEFEKNDIRPDELIDFVRKGKVGQ